MYKIKIEDRSAVKSSKSPTKEFVMEKELAGGRKCHIVILPYITQSHINAMIQLAIRFASKKVRVTVASSVSAGKAISTAAAAEFESLSFAPIFDDENDNPYTGFTGPGGYRGFTERFKSIGSRNLVNIIDNLSKSDSPVKCLIYDVNVQWGNDIAKQMGIASAKLFPIPCAFICSLYPLYYELKQEPLPFPAFPMPDLPDMRSPSWDVVSSSSTSRFSPFLRQVIEQFLSTGEEDWWLFTTFHQLEEDALKWMSKNFGVRVLTVGPTIPSYYLDKRIEADTNYGFNAFKPNQEIDHMKWLDTKQSCSVVYVAFGTSHSLSEQQIAEISEGLARTKCQFLWVGRETGLNKLTRGYLVENGLIIPWCSQLEVLSHPAIGCFITHCGMNSMLEAINCGVPVVPIPQVYDQSLIAYFAEKIWGVGVVPRELDGEEGLVPASEIDRCIKEVMMTNGENADKIKKNVIKWKELAKEALSEGGSSDKNIDEVIAHLLLDNRTHL